MQGIQGTWSMFTRILGNLLENSGECHFFNILGNVQEDSREGWKRFQGMLKKIPGNVEKDSGECLRRFRGMLLKILGNVLEDSRECCYRFWGMFQRIPRNPNFYLFLEILLVFYQTLLLNCYKIIQKNNYWAILLKTFS